MTDRYKLVHFYSPTWTTGSCSTASSDPHELRSVYDDPANAGVIDDLKHELDAPAHRAESSRPSAARGFWPAANTAEEVVS